MGVCYSRWRNIAAKNLFSTDICCSTIALCSFYCSFPSIIYASMFFFSLPSVYMQLASFILKLLLPLDLWRSNKQQTPIKKVCTFVQLPLHLLQCPSAQLPSEDAFPTIHWCTVNIDGRLLLSRRMQRLEADRFIIVVLFSFFFVYLMYHLFGHSLCCCRSGGRAPIHNCR